MLVVRAKMEQQQVTMFIALMDANCRMVSKRIRTCVATAGSGSAIVVRAARHSASRYAQYCEGNRFC